MSAPYEFVDIQARGPEMVARAFGNQVEYCRAAGAPITARVVAALGALVAGDAGGAVLARVRDWPGRCGRRVCAGLGSPTGSLLPASPALAMTRRRWRDVPGVHQRVRGDAG